MYDLTFDGFMLLVMSYQGLKAMAIKEVYIVEFNRMKAELDAIKDHTIKMVEDKLFARYPHWREVLPKLQNPETTSTTIDRANGWSERRTNRAKKSLTGWGLISPEVRAQMDKAHRQYAGRMAAITRQVLREQTDMFNPARS